MFEKIMFICVSFGVLIIFYKQIYLNDIDIVKDIIYNYKNLLFLFDNKVKFDNIRVIFFYYNIVILLNMKVVDLKDFLFRYCNIIMTMLVTFVLDGSIENYIVVFGRECFVKYD